MNVYEMYKLPPELFTSNFKGLFELKPKDRSSVLIYDKNKDSFYEKEIYRSYMSYGKTPKFSSKVKKSYMYLNKEQNLPQNLKPFLAYAKSIDSRYNSIYVNWYEAEDFIEPHRDCTNSFIDPEAPILVINLNESLSEERILTFEGVMTGDIIKVPLKHKHAYVIKDNVNYRHSVGKGMERRISITFRMLRD